MITTGFHSAAYVPAGATIVRVYVVIPGHYGSSFNGVEYPTVQDALPDAIDRARGSLTQDGTPVNPRITVDVRWSMTYPLGGGQDTLAERYTYADADEAQGHLDCIRKYAAAGA